jgi:23S rRNA pseudouridine1911/1915/1917 synthase
VRIDVDEERAGWRLDRVITEALTGLGRAAARRLFSDGRVSVRGPHGRRMRADKGTRAEVGMVIEVVVDDASGAARPDASLPLTLALERRDLVVVDKPAGVPSAPIRIDEQGTVANALVARFPEMAQIGFSPREPGLCHRLDTGTSGLLLAARTVPTFEAVTEALRGGDIDKRYLAIVDRPLEDEGEILIALVSQDKRVVACEDPFKAERLGAREARTTWTVVERHGSRSLLEVRAARAVRHQIRVHLAAVGAPLVGDLLYGGRRTRSGRFALHASMIAWRGDGVIDGFDVRSPLPADLRALLD